MPIHMDAIWGDVASFVFPPMGIKEALVQHSKLCSSQEI